MKIRMKRIRLFESSINTHWKT